MILKGQLQKTAINVAKNSAVIRNSYRWVRGQQQFRQLRAQISEMPSISQEDYLAFQPQIFKDIKLTQVTSEEKNALDSHSFDRYFSVSHTGAAETTVTDAVHNANFYSRQRMLATAYATIGEDKLKDWTMCDLGGCNGYYSFLAAELGFKHIDVVDPRPEHQREHQLIRDRLDGSGKVDYILGDINHKDVRDNYDIMLVQGLLYHLYDHYGFLQQLYKMTNKYLILETELSGKTGFLSLTKFENVANLRMGISGAALYPSQASVLGLLQIVGFKNVTEILHPRDVMDLHGYNKNRRIMLFCEK